MRMRESATLALAEHTTGAEPAGEAKNFAAAESEALWPWAKGRRVRIRNATTRRGRA